MKTLKQVLAEFPEEVLDRFDFSNATYKGALEPISGILCPLHGTFQQYSGQLRKNGATCPECGAEKRVKARRLSLDAFLQKARNIHGNKYSYEKTKYKNMTTKITVHCPCFQNELRKCMVQNTLTKITDIFRVAKKLQ